MAAQPTPRRRFQFRLRTLMLLAAILAVQCAVCLPALREWQAQKEVSKWTDQGGTGTIIPFQTTIGCTFYRFILRHDGRIIHVLPHAVQSSKIKPQDASPKRRDTTSTLDEST
jgi:hypothetical protein